MRGPWRAALALALHIGFFAFPLVVVLGLLGITAYTVRYSTGLGARAGLAALVVAAIFAVGLRQVLRYAEQPRGVPLRRDDQPKIWKAVDTICGGSGARVPDELRITSEPGALLREDTALLGLRLRARYLEVGLPLVAGLNAGELRAVLARELGGTAGAGRLATAADRAATAVERTATGLTGGPTKWLFNGYAKVFLAVAGSPGGRRRFEADTVAVKAAGKRAAITSLRKVKAIEFGWRIYCDEYLSMATRVEHRPDLVLGFRAFMDHPDRKPELAERVKQAAAAERGHPSTRERVEAMKQLKGGDRDPDDRPGFALLRDPRTTVPALEDELMVDGLGPRLPWPDLVRKAGAAKVARQTGRLAAALRLSGLECPPAIGGVLAAIHRGQGPELINPVLDPGLDPGELDAAVVDALTELLGGAVVDALITAGRAHHELDWAGEPVVRLADGRPLDPDRLVRPAAQDPRLIPGLHRALVDLGVPLQHFRAPAEDPEPTGEGVVSPVQFAGDRFDLVVTDRGLLLVPNSSTAARRLLAGALTRVREAENAQLAELAQTPVPRLREQDGAQWVDTRDIAAATLRQGRAGWRLALELYLDEASMSAIRPDAVLQGEGETAEVVVRSIADCEERGDPYRGLRELMGARLTVEERGADE